MNETLFLSINLYSNKSINSMYSKYIYVYAYIITERYQIQLYITESY